MITFDHIAVVAPSLREGVTHFHSATEVDIPIGGEHPDMGTHNHLTALGRDSFAEVIAINPDAAGPNRTRWFNLDNLERVQTAWLLRTDDIEGCIANAADIGIDLGKALPLQRGDLRWRFTVRDDGAIPLGGVAPLILQWDNADAHPASRMTDLGLRLDHIAIQTPNPTKLHQLLDVLGVNDKPEITLSDTPSVTVTFLDTNNQKRVLS